MKKILPAFLFACIAFFNSAQAQNAKTDLYDLEANLMTLPEIEVVVERPQHWDNICRCQPADSEYTTRKSKRRKRFALRSLLSAGTLAVVAVPYVLNKQKEQAKFSAQQSAPPPANSNSTEETSRDY